MSPILMGLHVSLSTAVEKCKSPVPFLRWLKKWAVIYKHSYSTTSFVNAPGLLCLSWGGHSCSGSQITTPHITERHLMQTHLCRIHLSIQCARPENIMQMSTSHNAGFQVKRENKSGGNKIINDLLQLTRERSLGWRREFQKAWVWFKASKGAELARVKGFFCRFVSCHQDMKILDWSPGWID